MQYIPDIVIICVFVLFVAVGARRGFVRSAVHFLGSVIAASLSSILGGEVAQWVFDTLFRQSLVDKIQEAIDSVSSGTVSSISEAVGDMLSSLPDFVLRALDDAGVTVTALSDIVAGGSADAAEMVADSISPVFVSFLRMLAVIVLFFLFMVLVRVLADVVARAFRLPILRELNGIAGGIFGFLLGIVLVWIVFSALEVFEPMLSLSAQTQLQEAIDDSVILKLLVNMNLLSGVFS